MYVLLKQKDAPKLFPPGELNNINYAVHRTIAIIRNPLVEDLPFLVTPESRIKLDSTLKTSSTRRVRVLKCNIVYRLTVGKTNSTLG